MPKRSLALQIAVWTLVAVLGLAGAYLALHYNYILFHVVVEVFAIVVASGLFMMTWNSRHLTDNGYLLSIGIAYLFVSAIELVHMLAHEGMAVWPGESTNLSTQLDAAARTLQGIALLLAPLFLHRKPRAHFLLAGYGVAASLLLTLILSGHFPLFYVNGAGPTLFKPLSEGLTGLVLFAAAVVMVKNRRTLDQDVWRLLITSITMTVATELAFDLSASTHDLASLLGHLFKIVAYYLMYKAIVETGLVKPYNLLFRNLAQRTEELQARNEELDAFSHTVAHDLKNPLSAIIGYTEMVERQDGDLTTEMGKEYVQVVGAGARRMSNIIQELLVLASMRQDQIKREPLDMGRIVTEVQKRLAYIVEQYHGQVSVPESWPTAVGNPAWVEEVWANYLANALKYGGRPPRVTLGATEQSNGLVRFWIRDNGAGIDPALQPLLFRPFSRLNQASTKGHGLGLSIVRHIVEKLGGQVGVESAPGAGSLFWFTLPCSVGRVPARRLPIMTRASVVKSKGETYVAK